MSATPESPSPSAAAQLSLVGEMGVSRPRRTKRANGKKHHPPRWGPSAPCRHKLRSIKKIFPWARLPIELRTEILKYVLIQENDITVEATGDRLDVARKRRQFVTTPIRTPFAKTFLLNRQFYKEGLPIAYGKNTFYFDDCLTFTYFLNDKFDARKYIKNVTIDIDQSHMSMPLSGFMDIWCLLNPQYRNIVVDHHVGVFQTALKNLVQLEQLTAKITIISKESFPNLKFFFPIFELFFLQQHQPHQIRQPTKSLEFEFTVPNPHFENTTTAPTKVLPMEVRKSLVATGLAVLYVLRLRKLHN